METKKQIEAGCGCSRTGGHSFDDCENRLRELQDAENHGLRF